MPSTSSSSSTTTTTTAAAAAAAAAKLLETVKVKSNLSKRSKTGSENIGRCFILVGARGLGDGGGGGGWKGREMQTILVILPKVQVAGYS